MKEYKFKLTFTEELLGTASNDPEIHDKFIASCAPDAPSRKQEIAALGIDEITEKSKTVFPRHEETGTPILWDYQIKGFFKDACGMLSRVKSTKSSAIKAYKKVIDGLVFVAPRQIPISFSGEIGSCQRPLRAQTAQGERISLANSETIPAGSSIEFTVTLFDEAHEKALLEWLDYGQLRGLGQWRNSGKGRFLYEQVE